MIEGNFHSHSLYFDLTLALIIGEITIGMVVARALKF